MISSPALEKQIGFIQIRESLQSRCLGQPGQRKVDNIIPLFHLADITRYLLENLELKNILLSGEPLSSKYFIDQQLFLDKIRIEDNYLDGAECLEFGRGLETIETCVKLLEKERSRCPSLFDRASEIIPAAVSSQLVYGIIDDKGNVRDDASVDLKQIRKNLREQQGRLRSLGDSAFRAAVGSNYVPTGALPTLREGRMVIPILAEYKRKFKGLILDESATGQTVFMEPAELLEVNNEIRELVYAERREEIKILKHLTNELRNEISWLITAFDFLAHIDFTRAKALLSIELDAVMPQVTDGTALQWQNARHPILIQALKGKRKVVPLNIALSPDVRMLLISGPNAGGKSVCLKTVGLLQYMFQCGLLVPVAEDSVFGIFEDILIDIGDQQSIENDLSTYSSHLRNMARFMADASNRSLVLMDELGSGTDPNFGGAIAQAVLQRLLEKKVWGLATTHYYNLKLFAADHPGIANASMRFDEASLQPLYVLDPGKPGSSFALEIARKTGIPSEVIQTAESLAGKQLTNLEKVLKEVQQERTVLDESLKRTTEKERALTVELEHYQKLSNELETRKKEIIQKAKAEADELLKHTNKEIEKTIRHIRENRAERQETKKIRNQLDSLARQVHLSQKTGGESRSNNGPIEVGDHVRISGQHGSGIVVGLRKEKAVVQFGNVASTVPLSALVRAGSEPAKEEKASIRGLDLPARQSHFDGLLDVRGKRVEEVMPLLQKFIDEGHLLGYGQLRVLHGKGEGILRKVIRDSIKTDQRVVKFQDEHVEHGGEGITIIHLA